MIAAVTWADGMEPAYYVNPTLLPVLIDLADTAGNGCLVWDGNGAARLNGFPVRLADQLEGSSASTSGDLLAVFGDLRLGTVLGRTKDVTAQTLRQLYAASDQVALKVTARVDVQVSEPSVLSKLTLS
jgi:HK97 family phage major capsid protein